MALELIGGTLFTLLYDGVKQAMSESAKLKFLLGDLKSTLDSLVPRDIQQIGEHNVELGLPNEEIESLQLQMEEGVKLVLKFSKFRVWDYYCCINGYIDQIIELDRSLKRLLEKLKLQEARDVKEVLLLSRQNRDKLDEVNRRLLDIHKLLQQRAGDVGSHTEMASGSNTETVLQPTEGNGTEQVVSLDGRAALGAVFGMLFNAVIEAKDKKMKFKPFFIDLKSTLDSLKPLIEEIIEYNKVLDLPKKELENFRIQMEEGVELVRKCSNARLWASYKKYKCTDKFLGLNESLQRLLNILKRQVARDVRETSVSVRNIEAMIKQIEESGVVQNQIQTKGWCAVPESSSPTVGSDVLNMQGTMDVKETLVSVRNTEESSVVKSQIEIKGTPGNHSRDTISNACCSAGRSQFLEAASPRMDESETDVQILEKSNLRVFSCAELKAITRNFRPDAILAEGGFGRVFKGWVDEKTLAPSKPGNGMVVAIKRLYPESMQGFQEWQSEVNFLGRLSHPNLVKLLGYCWEDKELLLVYEYMQKGSLENHLFRRSPGIEPLSWDNRLSIAIGAARGLAFLHTSEKEVIYRDFKASNILLDENYNAKICDVGLVKFGPTGGESHVTTRIMGTYGYAAPEYVATGQLYVKSDVYGFGVVLLEILTGLRALDTNRPSGKHNLVDLAKPLLLHERKLKTIMDVQMEGQYSVKAALQAAHVTLKCLAPDPKSRPSMREVLEALEQIRATKEKPKPSKLTSLQSRSSAGSSASSHAQSIHSSPLHLLWHSMR